MTKPCVLVFAGNDPSGGAGIAADIAAIAAQGAHALPVITALTVQDNDHVEGVFPVTTELMLQQAQTIVNKIQVSAIKIGIIGNLHNATALASWITQFKQQHPHCPVLLDPVLASGNNDALALDNAVDVITPLLNIATCITPNLPEAVRLCPQALSPLEQAQQLMAYGIRDVVIKGGHSLTGDIINSWFHHLEQQDWHWPRLPGTFHGSGCTLASALAGQLACGNTMQQALLNAQTYCHGALKEAYPIATGQLIPNRIPSNLCKPN